MENPVKTFDWEGQFEDGEPQQGQYENLTGTNASKVAIYILKKFEKYSRQVELAEEIIRFCEDQFVIWESPMQQPHKPHKRYWSDNWIVPCALEQYNNYVPIDAIVSTMIYAYKTAYETTGKKTYLAKAIALANSMTVAQDIDTGRYPTGWWGYKAVWINCAAYDCKVMMIFAKFLSKRF